MTELRIVVTHLTRMNEGNVCIAGYDESSGQETRPVLQSARIPRAMLATRTGSIELGSVVVVDRPRPRPVRPEIEDVVFDPGGILVDGTKTEAEVWDHVAGAAQSSLADVFGPDLKATSNTNYLPEGKGLASLGYILPSGLVRLEVMFDKVKARVEIAGQERLLAVTDLRLYKLSNKPDVPVIARINRELMRHAAVLAVGVGRAMWSSTLQAKVHWVQLNTLHVQT